VTVVTWDKKVEEKFQALPEVAVKPVPAVIRALSNRSNRPLFRFGLWIAAWTWARYLRKDYEVAVLPYDNKPVWYAISRSMPSVYCHNTTEFISMDLLFERELFKRTFDIRHRIYMAIDWLSGGKIFPRLCGEVLRYFPHRLLIDRLMGWRAPNHLCGFSGVDLLTVSGEENRTNYIKSGIAPDIVFTTGTPNYDSLTDIALAFDSKQEEKFRADLGFKNDAQIFSLFLSPSEFNPVQIDEIATVVKNFAKVFPDAHFLVKFHPKTNPVYPDLIGERLSIHTHKLKILREYQGEEFNAKLILSSSYLLQKQGTVGLIALRLKVPIFSYNLAPTDYEDDMYKILGGSIHVENTAELEAMVPHIFDRDVLDELKERQVDACRKFCMETKCADVEIARRIMQL